jgi:cell division control protein 6
MDEIGGNFLLILDEIDQLGEEDELLYEFPRARSMGEISNAKVGVIGISNNQLYKENLRQRVKSTLCDSEIRFDPYTSDELQTILDYYASIAFRDGVITNGVIAYCAAITAQESGDARFGLDLLEVAGEIARENDDTTVTEQHVKKARKELERGQIKQIYESGLTTQQQTVLLSTVFSVMENDGSARLKSIYNKYKQICEKTSIDCLTKRRVSDFTQKLTEKGLLAANENNNGAKGGRWFTYTLLASPRPIIEAAKDQNGRHAKIINSDIEAKLELYEAEHNNMESKGRQAQLKNGWN